MLSKEAFISFNLKLGEKMVNKNRYRLMLFLFMISLLIVATACSSTYNQYDGLKAVPFNEVKRKSVFTDKEKPVIGIAFGGGGVRGFMHLGVIKALEEADIKAKVVTGSSAGSIAASLYATGMQYEEIERIVFEANESDFLDLAFSSQGFIKGRKLAQWVKENTGENNIETLPIDLGIAVVDLNTRKPYLVVEGDIGEAVQASCSIPGAFVPVKSNDKLFVDGGVMSQIPVRSARRLGADFVIGVDIYCAKLDVKEGMMNTTYAVARLQTCELSRTEMNEADILIRPGFEPESAGSFEARDVAIEEGYRATKLIIPKIKRFIENSGT